MGYVQQPNLGKADKRRGVRNNRAGWQKSRWSRHSRLRSLRVAQIFDEVSGVIEIRDVVLAKKIEEIGPGQAEQSARPSRRDFPFLVEPNIERLASQPLYLVAAHFIKNFRGI